MAEVDILERRDGEEVGNQRNAPVVVESGHGEVDEGFLLLQGGGDFRKQLDFIRAKGSCVLGSQDQRSEKFREMLKSHFDLPTIAHYVIGRNNWNAASADQKQEYMKLFEELIVKSYGDRFTLYTGEGFRVTGVHAESEKDTRVTSEITHPDGSEPTTIEWRIHHKDDKMGIIDVVVEGVSLSVTQQQEYASITQRDGGKLDGLLTRMRQQLQDPPLANQHG